MPRTVLLLRSFSLTANASADCDLRYAPPEIRETALAFHHRLNQRGSADVRKASTAARAPWVITPRKAEKLP